MSLSRVCLFNGLRIALYSFYLLILLDGNFQREKVDKPSPFVQFWSHPDKVTLNIILLGFIKKQREYAVTSYSYSHAFLKKRRGYCNRLRPSVTPSPPKQLDEIQPNLVCELLT